MDCQDGYPARFGTSCSHALPEERVYPCPITFGVTVKHNLKPKNVSTNDQGATDIKIQHRIFRLVAHAGEARRALHTREPNIEKLQQAGGRN